MLKIKTVHSAPFFLTNLLQSFCFLPVQI